MERYFCTFVNYQYNELDKLLIAEILANNKDSASIKLSLFFASRGLHPHISFNVVDFSDITNCKQINKKKTINISKIIQLM